MNDTYAGSPTLATGSCSAPTMILHDFAAGLMSISIKFSNVRYKSPRGFETVYRAHMSDGSMIAYDPLQGDVRHYFEREPRGRTLPRRGVRGVGE